MHFLTPLLIIQMCLMFGELPTLLGGITLSFQLGIIHIVELTTLLTPYVIDTKYHNIVISDHSPVTLTLNIQNATRPQQIWRPTLYC